MTSWIAPGNKCVCIKDDWPPGDPRLIVTRVPMLNEVLTISGVVPIWMFAYLTFRKISNPTPIAFRSDMFRPLISNPKTDEEDLELFRHIASEVADGEQVGAGAEQGRARNARRLATARALNGRQPGEMPRAGWPYRPLMTAAGRALVTHTAAGAKLRLSSDSRPASGGGRRISSHAFIAGTCGRPFGVGRSYFESARGDGLDVHAGRFKSGSPQLLRMAQQIRQDRIEPPKDHSLVSTAAVSTLQRYGGLRTKNWEFSTNRSHKTWVPQSLRT